MKLCVVSFKECWQDEVGDWFSFGGFPLQMRAISSLFDQTTMVVVRGHSRNGGIPLPRNLRVVALRRPTGRNTRRKLSVLAHLPYYLAKIDNIVQDSDVVHVPLPGDIAFLGMLVGLMRRKYLIARYGSSWETTPVTTLMNKVTKAFMRFFAGGHNVMLATGIGELQPAPNMNWLYVTAISKPEISSFSPNLDRTANKPLRLAYVGRLSPEKGVMYLVQALGLLREEEDQSEKTVMLTIVGDGPQKEDLVNLAEEERCSDTIEFVGQLNRSDLINCLLGIDICVLPSLTESFCKARLDAMLCGVPVITTGVGFGREIIGQDGERGWLIPSRDPYALAQILRDISSETHDWAFIRKRCRTYAEKFTLEDWSQKIGDICARQWNITLNNGKFQK
jgi:glycosyltransferase involved in cell wall biosynthesis